MIHRDTSTHGLIPITMKVNPRIAGIPLFTLSFIPLLLSTSRITREEQKQHLVMDQGHLPCHSYHFIPFTRLRKHEG